MNQGRIQDAQAKPVNFTVAVAIVTLAPAASAGALAASNHNETLLVDA